MNTRISWIDAAKGIGILLVIIGHTSLPDHLKTYIYTFHMPLFFFIAGFLYKFKKEPFISKKASGLLVPYFWFSLISILLLYMRSIFGTYTDHLSLENILDILVLAKGTQIFYNPPLWFLTSIFLVEISFNKLNKEIENKYFLSASIVVLYIFSEFVFKSTAFVWTIDDVGFYLVFFGLGYWYKNNNALQKQYLVFAIASLSIIVFNYSSFSSPNIFINLLLKILKPIPGIALIVFISRFLQNIKRLNFIGRNSLPYFALHIPLGFYLYSKAQYYLRFDFSPSIEPMFVKIFTVIFLTPVVLFINSKAPFIVMKKQKNSQQSSLLTQ